MLLKVVLLIPTICSLVLCSYLLIGLCLYFRALYKTAPAVSRLSRQGALKPRLASTSSRASIDIEAIPAT
jgi:hypothetical protein